MIKLSLYVSCEFRLSLEQTMIPKVPWEREGRIVSSLWQRKIVSATSIAGTGCALLPTAPHTVLINRRHSGLYTDHYLPLAKQGIISSISEELENNIKQI